MSLVRMQDPPGWVLYCDDPTCHGAAYTTDADVGGGLRLAAWAAGHRWSLQPGVDECPDDDDDDDLFGDDRDE